MPTTALKILFKKNKRAAVGDRPYQALRKVHIEVIFIERKV